jgi:hypothetical protein
MSTMSSCPVQNTISWPTTPSRLSPKFACGHLQLRFHARQSQLQTTVAPSDPRFPPIWPHASTRTPARYCITRFRNGDMHRWQLKMQLGSSTPKTVQTEARCASKELRSDRQVKPWYSRLKSSVVILPSSLHTYASSTVPVGYDTVPQVNLPALHTHAAIQHFRIHNASQYLTTHFSSRRQMDHVGTPPCPNHPSLPIQY